MNAKFKTILIETIGNKYINFKLIYRKQINKFNF